MEEHLRLFQKPEKNQKKIKEICPSENSLAVDIDQDGHCGENMPTSAENA